MERLNFYEFSLFSFVGMLSHFVKSVLQTLRFLSLDVVFGGVVFANAIGHVFHVTLHPSVLCALACAIWLIYTLDHLVDALRGKSKPTIPRHVFHLENKNILFVFFILVAVFGLGLLVYLPHQVLIYGCILLGIVGLYFLTIWFFRIFFVKEVFIAVLYACGIFIGSFSALKIISLPFFLFFFQSIIIALINLLIFSIFEEEKDKKDDQRSWVTHFGLNQTIRHMQSLFILELFIAFFGLFWFSGALNYLVFQLILLLMTISLWIIQYFSDSFAPNERYRWAGDIIFLFTAFIFLF
jgi:hypothetical protein